MSEEDLYTIDDHDAVVIDRSDGYPDFECRDCGLESDEETWFYRRKCE